MKEDNKITLAEIRAALELVKEVNPPDRWIETMFGMVKIGCFGKPVEIMLKKDVHELLKNYAKEITRHQGGPIVEGSIGEFEGLPIITTKHIDNI